MLTIMLVSWTETRKNVSGNDNLALVGKKLGLGELLRQHPRNVQDVSPGMLATAVEAVVGAVWLDSGMKMHEVKVVMGRMGLILFPRTKLTQTVFGVVREEDGSA